MAKGLSIQVEGLKELRAKFGGIPKAVSTEVDNQMDIAANDFVNRAVNDAPVDESLLRQGISKRKIKTMQYDVVSAAPYSAYIEFGTKSKAQIPADLAEYAAQFKGKGGSASGKGFYDSILAWVKRKGIASTYSVKTRKKTKSLDNTIAEEQAAFAIYLSIMRRGIHAHPFFFKQRAVVYAELQQRLEPALKKALG